MNFVAGGSHTVVGLRQEYRRVEGVLLPTVVIEKIDEMITQTLTIESVSFATIDPNVFALPPAVRALLGR